MNQEDVEALRRFLGIDLNDPLVRQRAWQRLHVFRDVIAECEADRSMETAAWLRRICRQAIFDQDATCLAILAGPDATEDDDDRDMGERPD